jgi:hypothetical protein
MGAPTLFIVVIALLGAITASRLVYVDRPSGDHGVAYVANLAHVHDMRGDYGDFVLVVDHDGKVSGNVVFADFDDMRLVYYVAEAVELAFPSSSNIPSVFSNYEHVLVRNKFVFAVLKEREDEFVGHMPFNFEFVRVPTSALPAPFTATESFGSFEPDPKIASYISLVTTADLRNFVTYLTGEASNIITRQAQSAGALEAQAYLVQQFTNFGFKVSTQAFRPGYSSNVLAVLLGVVDPTKYVLVTAHYDSRGPSLTSTTDPAPGANDNGSGTGALLQIAKLIFESKISFGYSVVLIAFSGEEQGLVGSNFAAAQFKSEDADIIAVLNADMIAYRSPNEVPQLAFASRSSTPSLNNILSNISVLYLPELTVGTSTACCTDHASFYNQGYAAASFFERNGPIADPQYHKAGDLVNREGYDIELQYPLIVKAVYASLLTIAEYQS